MLPQPISLNRWGLEHDIPKGQSQLSRRQHDEGLSHNHSRNLPRIGHWIHGCRYITIQHLTACCPPNSVKIGKEIRRGHFQEKPHPAWQRSLFASTRIQKKKSQWCWTKSHSKSWFNLPDVTDDIVEKKSAKMLYFPGLVMLWSGFDAPD